MIGGSKNAHDLLVKIGWSIPNVKDYRLRDGTLSTKGTRLVNQRIKFLFGTTYEDAKVKHSTGYLGDT